MIHTLLTTLADRMNEHLSKLLRTGGGGGSSRILCKARMLTYDGSEVKHIGSRISSEKLN